MNSVELNNKRNVLLTLNRKFHGNQSHFIKNKKRETLLLKSDSCYLRKTHERLSSAGRLKLESFATDKIEGDRSARRGDQNCLVRLRHRFVRSGIFGTRSDTQNPYVDKYTYGLAPTWKHESTFTRIAQVTYDLLVRFPHMLKRVYFSRGDGARARVRVQSNVGYLATGSLPNGTKN